MWPHPYLQHVGWYLRGEVSWKVIVWVITRLSCTYPVPLALVSIFLGGMGGLIKSRHLVSLGGQERKEKEARWRTSWNSCSCLAIFSPWLFVSWEKETHSHLFVKLNCIDWSMNECWSLCCICWRSHWNLGSDKADMTCVDYTSNVDLSLD